MKHFIPLVSALGLQILAASPASAACMTKSQADGRAPPLTILVPQREIAQYEALGFAREECGPKVQSKEQYRDAICRFAQVSDETVSGPLPVPPKQLCTSAQAAISEGE